jgi:hypothetical protein
LKPPGTAKIWALAAVVLVAWSSEALSDIIGPLLPRGTFEIGLQERWVERSVRRVGKELDWDQNDLAVVIRWGATDFGTVSVEGMTGSGPWVEDRDETQFYYLIGAAVQGTLWHSERYIVMGGFQYTATLQRYDDPYRCTLSTSSYCWEVLGQLDAILWNQPVSMWAGPAVAEHVVDYLQGIYCRRETYSSRTSWGGVVGATMVAWQHVSVTGHLLWTENPQPRLGILYRF